MPRQGGDAGAAGTVLFEDEDDIDRIALGELRSVPSNYCSDSDEDEAAPPPAASRAPLAALSAPAPAAAEPAAAPPPRRRPPQELGEASPPGVLYGVSVSPGQPPSPGSDIDENELVSRLRAAELFPTVRLDEEAAEWARSRAARAHGAQQAAEGLRSAPAQRLCDLAEHWSRPPPQQQQDQQLQEQRLEDSGLSEEAVLLALAAAPPQRPLPEGHHPPRSDPEEEGLEAGEWGTTQARAAAAARLGRDWIAGRRPAAPVAVVEALCAACEALLEDAVTAPPPPPAPLPTAAPPTSPARTTYATVAVPTAYACPPVPPPASVPASPPPATPPPPSPPVPRPPPEAAGAGPVEPPASPPPASPPPASPPRSPPPPPPQPAAPPPPQPAGRGQRPSAAQELLLLGQARVDELQLLLREAERQVAELREPDEACPCSAPRQRAPPRGVAAGRPGLSSPPPAPPALRAARPNSPPSARSVAFSPSASPSPRRQAGRSPSPQQQPALGPMVDALLARPVESVRAEYPRFEPSPEVVRDWGPHAPRELREAVRREREAGLFAAPRPGSRPLPPAPRRSPSPTARTPPWSPAPRVRGPPSPPAWVPPPAASRWVRPRETPGVRPSASARGDASEKRTGLRRRSSDAPGLLAALAEADRGAAADAARRLPPAERRALRALFADAPGSPSASAARPPRPSEPRPGAAVSAAGRGAPGRRRRQAALAGHLEAAQGVARLRLYFASMRRQAERRLAARRRAARAARASAGSQRLAERRLRERHWGALLLAAARRRERTAAAARGEAERARHRDAVDMAPEEHGRDELRHLDNYRLIARELADAVGAPRPQGGAQCEGAARQADEAEREALRMLPLAVAELAQLRRLVQEQSSRSLSREGGGGRDYSMRAPAARCAAGTPERPAPAPARGRPGAGAPPGRSKPTRPGGGLRYS